jgi:hypothetical protein
MTATANTGVAAARALMRVGAVAAIIGGTLRIVSTFLPYQAELAWLEAFYGVIDMCLLVGLLAVYLASAEAAGVAGLALFLVALAGLASIVGPDAPAFGVDFYRVGALVFVAGLAGLSVQLLRRRVMTYSALAWVATLACSLAAAALPVAFLAAGLLLGVGFVLAGVSILRALT